MHVTFEEAGEVVTAAVHGEVDADNCDALGTTLLEDTEGSASYVVDLSALTFVDSSGINALLKVSEAVRGRGQQFRLANPSPAVHRVLEITGLLEHFGLD